MSCSQRLLTRRLPKRNPIVAQRLEFTLIGFDIVQHHANFLTRLQRLKIIPTGVRRLAICRLKRKPSHRSERGKYQPNEQNMLRLIHGLASSFLVLVRIM